MSSRIFRDDLLKGKHALVTGGGTGIGRATALELASLGADVAVVGRRGVPLERVKGEIEARGVRALALTADIREPEQVAAAVAAIVREWGGVDLLVNNAGGHFVKRAEEIPAKGFHAVVATNLSGTFNVTQEVARQAMLARGAGVIVNIVIDMWQGTPGAAHAGAARAAVENLTKSLSMEWAPRGIRVNAIAPGTIDTGGLAAYPQEVRDDLLGVIPLGRAGRPEEVAWMIAYLASPAGEWITGETLCLDGGARNWGGLWSVFTRASARTASA